MDLSAVDASVMGSMASMYKRNVTCKNELLIRGSKQIIFSRGEEAAIRKRVFPAGGFLGHWSLISSVYQNN